MIEKMHHRHLDWILVGAISVLLILGMITMFGFTDTTTNFFGKQLLWACVSVGTMIGLSFIDLTFLKNGKVLLILFGVSLFLLILVLFIGSTINGAQSWISIGGFTLQPADSAKVVFILILAKYFSRRHVMIGNIKHIIISAIYLALPMGLILLQPDLGSAFVFGCIWLGMILVSGINKKHLALLFILGISALVAVWFGVLADYQKNRIVSFVHPLEDIHGTGYNAYQSLVAVGSGQILGKGVGYGTQSRLHFLPEFQTDFIFAAFAEEWGFIGGCMVVVLLGIVIWRILRMSIVGSSNFEILFGVGVVVFFLAHSIVNIGMNIGLMPITGIPLPFMSYGGSHLLAECIAVGIIMSMYRYSRRTHREDLKHEFLGI